MELIVKIGADQGGLQKQIAGMKAQFANQNMSMPTGWTPRAPSSGLKLTAGQQDFLDAQDAASGGGFIQKKVGKMYVKKGLSFLKGILIGEVIGLAAEALNVLGDKYWESVYGVSAAANAKILASHEKITKAVASHLAAKTDFDQTLGTSAYEHTTLDNKITMNEQGKAAADSDVKAKQKAFNDAKWSFEQSKIQVFKTVEGGRTMSPEELKKSDAKNGTVNGERLMTAQERRDIVLQMAKAEEELFKARKKQIEIGDKLQGTVDERIARDLKAKEEAANEKSQQGLEQAKIEKIKPFAADSMAQSGLFSGSSLLMNPTLTVAQDQLKVLREIAVNTGQNPFNP